MDDDIFRDRRIAERRLADDVSGDVICRRVHQERRRGQLLDDSWRWWLRVNYVDYSTSIQRAAGK